MGTEIVTPVSSGKGTGGPQHCGTLGLGQDVKDPSYSKTLEVDGDRLPSPQES